VRRPTGFDAPPRALVLDRPAAPLETSAPVEPARDEAPAPSARELRSALRRASRDRRRAESAEVRRFTRSTRHRRRLLAGTVAAVVVLLGVPLGLAVSPVFAVRTIAVEGAAPAVTAAVRARLAGLEGTPLALVDPAVVRRAVQAVPQVASYRASSLPPGTLAVRLVERVAVGQLRRGGGWEQVDPAGVVIATGGTPVTGRPVLDVPDTTGPRFGAAVAVLRALPASVLGRVAAISAPGVDEVSLRLTSGLTVRWGSADDAASKGAALRAALQHVAHHATVVDVSAPGLVTVR
jgi:cell division septal protein FtsQ